MALTPEEFEKKLDRFAKGLPKVVDSATFLAAQRLNADITGRIFRVGGTKDVKGGTRGYRSERWVTEREDAGLQVNRVDLVFSGDLQRSIKLQDAKNETAVKIVGQKQVDKARGNERWFDNDVFIASNKEAKIAVEVFTEEIADYIEKIF